MAVATETCANCGTSIGKLEKAFVYEGNVVCARCNAQLASPAQAPPLPVGYAAPPPPNYRHPSAAEVRNVVTTQRTGKLWKSQQLIAAVAAIVGVCMLTVGANGRASDSTTAAGILVLIFGLLWFAFARIMAWWFHG
jgi:hypothetical protein